MRRLNPTGQKGGAHHVESRLMRESLVDKGLLAGTESPVRAILPDLNGPDLLDQLRSHGLLLQADVCALVAGAPVRGSWWADPASHDIFRASCELEAHPDVLVCKLISGKVTYVHRTLWLP